MLQLGRRLGRHTAIYATGAAITLVLGLFTVVVVTRILDPSEYGRLSVLVVLSGLLTTLYNLGTLQGTLLRAYGVGGGGGDDDDGDDGDDDVELEEATKPVGAARRRRALGSGLIVTVALAVVGTGVCAGFAGPVAAALGASQTTRLSILLAAAAGGLTAVWRLMANTMRMSGRPVGYLTLELTRPALLVMALVPFFLGGGTVEDILVCYVIASAGAMLISLAATKPDWVLRFDRHEAREIFRRGKQVIPVTLSMVAIRRGDVLLLAAFSTTAEVGLFRVATSVGRIAAYVVTAFRRAWSPLRRSPLQRAVNRDHGLEAGSTVARYYLLVSAGIVVALAAFSEQLVRIAPPQYAQAAPLIPLVALGSVLHGWFVTSFRVVGFARGLGTRRRVLIALTFLCLIAFLVAAVLLIPPLAAYGAALAVVAGFGAGSIGVIVLARRGGRPLAGGGRLVRGLAVAAACYVVVRGAGESLGEWGLVVGAATTLAYPALLVLAGAVPRRAVAPLIALCRSMMPDPRLGRRLSQRLERLEPADVEVLRDLAGERRSVAELAASRGESADVLLRRMVGSLATLAGVPAPDPQVDGRLGPYLIYRGSVIERDELGRELLAAGVDPLTMDELGEVVHRLRRLPVRRWPKGAQCA